jgi:heme exporter protein D
MNWNSMAEFIEMGGHGLYVWGSFVMVAAALLWEAVMLVQRRQRALENVRELRALSRGGRP